MNRRESLGRISVGLLALALTSGRAFGAPPAKRRMVVYKSPSCACCVAWSRHVRAAGFDVEEIDVQDVTPYKKRFGVPLELASCHTAIVGAFAFEGHVPADLIEQFLRRPPADAKGLAVPGMPVGSPGMEMGARKDPYDVVLFKRNGSRSVFARR